MSVPDMKMRRFPADICVDHEHEQFIMLLKQDLISGDSAEVFGVSGAVIFHSSAAEHPNFEMHLHADGYDSADEGDPPEPLRTFLIHFFYTLSCMDKEGALGPRLCGEAKSLAVRVAMELDGTRPERLN